MGRDTVRHTSHWDATANAGGRVCPHAHDCGGCTAVSVPYEQQLAAKDRSLAALFADMVRRDGTRVLPILGAADPWHYRNKVTSPLAPGGRGPNGGRQILTGMYAPGTHRLVNTDGCLIENLRAQQVIAALPSLVKKFKLTPYDEDRHEGFLRHVVVRVGHESEEVLVTLVTNGADFPSSKAFCRALLKKCPFVTTVVQNINTARTNVILGPSERRLYGPGFILDTLCGLSFRLSSHSFYQVNAGQTARLYETAIQLAALDGTQSVLDAYCGTGTIGLVAAARGAAQVIGVESVESAVADARQNARHNGVENARFVVADASDFMVRMAAEGQAVDVAFLDPPRAGCGPGFIDALGTMGPERVVYVSCNPETQKSDLDRLGQQGYRVEVIQPVDMFPHTEHIESVALATRKGG